MLSVHFHALGDRLEFRGAPAILLRPEVEPMPLRQALEVVWEDPEKRRLREAVWALVRGVPPPRDDDESKGAALTRRYGPEFEDFVRARLCEQIDDFDQFDARRGEYRRDARGFAAALVAYSQDDTATFNMLRPDASRETRFTQAMENTEILGGLTPEGFLGHIAELPSASTKKGSSIHNTREATVDALYRFEDEVGIGLDRYIGEFADTVAFMEAWKPPRRIGAPKAQLTVYPTSCVTTQDARTLTTAVTASAVVTTSDFLNVTRAIDPRRWQTLSDNFHHVSFVDDAFALQPITLDDQPIGLGLQERADLYLVHEDVGVVSDIVGKEIGRLSNVLRIEKFNVVRGATDGECSATLRFSLYRSVGSRILWDERAGGMLLDSGWVKVRHIADGVWRMTSRKIVRFSDRTPNTSWDGPLDFGQMLNYLTPAALSAWLENDLYSSEDPSVHGTNETRDADHERQHEPAEREHTEPADVRPTRPGGVGPLRCLLQLCQRRRGSDL